MTAKVIDFRSKQPLPSIEQQQAATPAPDRVPTCIVEFFDDEAFPFRFKGIDPNSPDYIRSCARQMANCVLALLAIAYEKDGDASLLPRLVGYVMHDGSALADCYNPPGFENKGAYNWLADNGIEALRRVIRAKRDEAYP